MKILVVDDDSMSRKVVAMSLSIKGHDIVEACDGFEAMEIFKNEDIGILISDWMMPIMDGLELTRRIRAYSQDRYVYIIMLTARTDKEDMLEGFDAGVDEYINKPPHIAELDARLKVGIRIVNLEQKLIEEQRKVTRYAQEMEHLADKRAEQLIHADRMATLGTLSAGIAHEINNPTTFISGNALTLEKFWPVINKQLENCKPDEPDLNQVNFIKEEMPGAIKGIKKGAARITRIVSGLKSFARQDKPRKVPVDIHKTIGSALLMLTSKLKNNISVEKDFDESLTPVLGDPQHIEQVFINILSNAVDAMEEVEDAELTIRTRKDPEFINILIEDNGSGLNKTSINKIWDPFFTTKSTGKGTGLGMSISHGIIEAHNGTISVSNKQEGGASFLVKLPAVMEGE